MWSISFLKHVYVEITKFQSELTKLQRTERCETQNIQRQFSFPSTNLFVTVAERQQNTATTTKKEDEKKQKQDYVVSVFFLGSLLLFFSLHMAKAGNDKAQCVFCVCGNHPRHAHTHSHTHIVFTLTLRF